MPSWTVITVSGERRIIEGKPTIEAIKQAIGAKCLDTVNFHNGYVMMVDDSGFIDGKQTNPIATDMYHSRCKPGTTHPICGDVAIVLDADFE